VFLTANICLFAQLTGPIISTSPLHFSFLLLLYCIHRKHDTGLPDRPLKYWCAALYVWSTKTSFSKEGHDPLLRKLSSQSWDVRCTRHEEW